MNEIPPYLISVSSDNASPPILIAHIEDGNMIFMQKRLRDIMQNYGIIIPPGNTGEFNGKSIVYLKNSNDRLFEKAFRTVYYHLCMPKNEYKWVNELPSILKSSS